MRLSRVNNNIFIVIACRLRFISYTVMICSYFCERKRTSIHFRPTLSLSHLVGVMCKFFSKTLDCLEPVIRAGKLDLAEQTAEGTWALKLSQNLSGVEFSLRLFHAHRKLVPEFCLLVCTYSWNAQKWVNGRFSKR